MPNPIPSAALSFRETVSADDRQSVRALVESTGFFNPAEVDVAVELVDEHLAKGAQASGYYFIFAHYEGQTIGYACYGPIAGTEVSFDLFWIAVDKHYQGRRIGQALLRESERRIFQAGGRRVYIETSHRGQYESTRAFYLRSGYQQEAVLQDFYAPGDDKVIYVKALAASP
jgi:ribosomal protein S18 acetylase RimI-like enzyme